MQYYIYIYTYVYIHIYICINFLSNSSYWLKRRPAVQTELLEHFKLLELQLSILTWEVFNRETLAANLRIFKDVVWKYVQLELKLFAISSYKGSCADTHRPCRLVLPTRTHQILRLCVFSRLLNHAVTEVFVLLDIWELAIRAGRSGESPTLRGEGPHGLHWFAGSGHMLSSQNHCPWDFWDGGNGRWFGTHSSRPGRAHLWLWVMAMGQHLWH